MFEKRMLAQKVSMYHNTRDDVYHMSKLPFSSEQTVLHKTQKIRKLTPLAVA